ncbi:hypothetical protein [Alkaliphilus hydrothermalis]|uniref:Uncharacterized protein n=1 Tax=Alkaliphilus hydrothermalis TaxID=1482730 RepID=A0ABS2NMD8_9FIRM|nr:hypothetical protein [Alkaliphilus hydrothermalis]MBM7614081.1 hypothetical protein [Alkaliphilus hydrothermalis]
MTKKGRELRPVLINILNQWMDIVLTDFTLEGKNYLVDLLKKMLLNICREYEMTVEGRKGNE